MSDTSTCSALAGQSDVSESAGCVSESVIAVHCTRGSSSKPPTPVHSRVKREPLSVASRLRRVGHSASLFLRFSFFARGRYGKTLIAQVEHHNEKGVHNVRSTSVPLLSVSFGQRSAPSVAHLASGIGNSGIADFDDCCDGCCESVIFVLCRVRYDHGCGGDFGVRGHWGDCGW